ncbi:MAG TPA: glutathione binding-like protein [Polyangiaceae bacterium]
MKIYFSPLACSLASKITVYEAGAETDVDFVEVDPKTKKTLPAGDDYLAVSRLGLVPALVRDDGALLTENGAILQALARRFTGAKLAPESDDARARLQMYLSFVGSELHKLLAMLLDEHAPPTVKEYATTKVGKRLSWIDGELEGKAYLLGTFSVADAYLFTVLNWTLVLPVKLDAYANVTAFMTRMRARPAVARAFDEERKLYVEELARHGKA